MTTLERQAMYDALLEMDRYDIRAMKAIDDMPEWEGEIDFFEFEDMSDFTSDTEYKIGSDTDYFVSNMGWEM